VSGWIRQLAQATNVQNVETELANELGDLGLACAVRWQSGRMRQFAKRKLASRRLDFLRKSFSISTSLIERVGWRWLWTHCFAASGDNRGDSSTRSVAADAPLTVSRDDPQTPSIELSKLAQRTVASKSIEDVREAGANWTRRRVRRSRSGNSIYAYAALLPL
jgi:hypothetical protein